MSKTISGTFGSNAKPAKSKRSKVNPSKKVTSIYERATTHDIPVRQINFEFSDDIPKYWFSGDPIRTMLLTALSCTFPEGERMFIRAVRRFEDKISDPELKKQVRAFIGQEAHHGKQHEAFNQFMKRKGVATSYLEKYTKNGIAKEEQWLSPERMLAKTCALEHFTALYAETLLEHPELVAEIDERLQPLWIWHALEESEHKAVAFDVYQNTVGSYWIRSSEMMFTSLLFTFFTVFHTVQLLHIDKTPVNLGKSARRNLKELWKHRKVLGSLGKHYLAYYRPSFHPAKKDSAHLRQHGLEQLNTLLEYLNKPSVSVG